MTSLRASSLACAGGGAGKGRRACNFISGIWISASKKSMRNADWQRWWHHYSWHMFFKVCLHSRSLPLRADWRKSNNSVDREAQGNWRWNSNSRDVVASCPSFSRPAARVPWRARRLFDEIWTSPPNFIFMDFKSYFPVLIFPWNYLPCVCNLEYNFNTVLHCTHAKLQGIWYSYICLWQHSFHGNGKNSFLK